MNDPTRPRLMGETTLFGSWGALATLSPGAHLIYTQSAVAAVFPQWEVLNNAVLFAGPSLTSASRAAAELADVYAAVGVKSWALWLPSESSELTALEGLGDVPGMTRDTTTIVMTRELMDTLPLHPSVRSTTVAAAGLAGDEPVAAADLPEPDDASDVEGWVLVRDELAVAGAWTYRHGTDVGVYAVGTAPSWRGRGIAAALMRHVLADAAQRGARTASLQSTAMGLPLYTSLGFRRVGRYDEWVPTQRPSGPVAATAIAKAVS